MAAIRRYIYEYYRFNPQLGTKIHTAEVYETTLKKAERAAVRRCKRYKSYGSLDFKRIIQVSEPIVEGVDVIPCTKMIDDGSRKKEVKEYQNTYTENHTAGWDKLTDVAEKV